MRRAANCLFSEMGSGILVTEDAAFASLLRREESHRWLNFLQLIATDLARQTAQIADAKVHDAFRRTNDQIQALGALQLLLGEPYIQELQALKDVTPKLSSTINTLVFQPRGFVLSTKFEPDVLDLRVNARRMRLLALSLTELLVNVAKHGFNARENHVSFSIFQINGFLVCSIVDKGPGLATDVARADSEGLVLVDTMTRAIGGKCRWISGRGGTSAEVRIPLEILPTEFVVCHSKEAEIEAEGTVLASFEREDPATDPLSRFPRWSQLRFLGWLGTI